MNTEHRGPRERRPWRTDEEWTRLRERVTASDASAAERPGVARPGRWIVAAAAALLIGAVGVRAGWRMRRVRSPVALAPPQRVATTGVGERLTIRLADSSVVTVGPVSTIRYRVSDTERSVAIVDGIAAFHVVHDAARPFRVRAKGAVMTDVGTDFVVRAYSADSAVDVSVTAGLVAVSSGAPAPLQLRAGDVAVVDASGQAARVAGRSAQTAAAWVRGSLVFENAPLGAVAAELGRWFGVQIRIPDRQVAQRRVSAVYNRPTLAGVLDAITATLPVRSERSGHVVTLLPASR